MQFTSTFNLHLWVGAGGINYEGSKQDLDGLWQLCAPVLFVAQPLLKLGIAVKSWYYSQKPGARKSKKAKVFHS